MPMCDWSSDVCSSDLGLHFIQGASPISIRGVNRKVSPRCTSCIVTPNQRVYSIENNSKGPPLLSLLALSHSYSCAGQSGRCPAQISPPVRACLSAWRSVVSLPQWSGTSTSHHISPQPCCWGGPTRRLRWARPLLPTPLMHTLCSEPATWVTCV